METSGKIEGARQDSNHVIRAMFIYVKGDVISTRVARHFLAFNGYPPVA